MKRPLVLFALSLVGGIACTNITHSYTFAILSSAVMFLVLYIFLRDKERAIFIAAGMVFFYLAGATYYLCTFNQNFYKFDKFAGEQVTIKGYIDSVPELKDSRISYILKVEEVKVSGEDHKKSKVGGKIRLSTLADSDLNFLEYGREVVVSGRLSIPKGRTNPQGFSYRNYLNHSGVSATLFAVERNIHPKESIKGNVLLRVGLNIRNRIVETINNSLPYEQAGLLNAMLVGYKGGLTQEMEKAFRRSGLIHIMAISGAHVAFIMIPLVFISRRLRIGKSASNLIIIAGLFAFAFITGLGPSVLRAVIMATVVLGGQIAKREADTYTSIALAAIILLLLNPGNLFSVGFQLSFTATISIVLFHKNIKNFMSFSTIPEPIADILSLTLAAQLGVLPLVASYFNEVSLISILSNLLVVPMLGIIMNLGILMAILGQINMTLCVFVGYCNNTLLSFVLFITKMVVHIPYSSIFVSTPSIVFIIIYYIAILYLFWFKPTHKVKPNYKLYTWAGVLVLVLILFNVFLPKGMKVVFLDVGQGDGAFIRTCGGKVVLVDGGPDFAGENSVVPFLFDCGISKIDLIVVSHGHDDHIKGLIPVFEYFKVNNIVVPNTEFMGGIIDIYGIANEKDINIEKCEEGNIIKLDKKTHINILHPKVEQPIKESPENNNSLVAMLCYDKIKILFTGDIEKEAELLLLQGGGDLEADVLKVAHHGSSTSSGKEFIDAVFPVIAVISVGSNNSFGHPSKQVLELFDEKNIKTLRTDINGAIILTSHGKNIRIKTVVN
ncbi:MAG: DNA internalization-related competence protein ComEC/Rec2 [Clostridium sp.]|nr:DNA internalization-related competence protein ComEC/Rec2 [Clostridium sp.]